MIIEGHSVDLLFLLLLPYLSDLSSEAFDLVIPTFHKNLKQSQHIPTRLHSTHHIIHLFRYRRDGRGFKL